MQENVIRNDAVVEYNRNKSILSRVEKWPYQPCSFPFFLKEVLALFIRQFLKERITSHQQFKQLQRKICAQSPNSFPDATSNLDRIGIILKLIAFDSNEYCA